MKSCNCSAGEAGKEKHRGGSRGSQPPESRISAGLKFWEFSQASDGENRENRRRREGNFCSSRPVLASAALARGSASPGQKTTPPKNPFYLFICFSRKESRVPGSESDHLKPGSLRSLKKQGGKFTGESFHGFEILSCLKNWLILSFPLSI